MGMKNIAKRLKELTALPDHEPYAAEIREERERITKLLQG
jgi:hypothetical protein